MAVGSDPNDIGIILLENGTRTVQTRHLHEQNKVPASAGKLEAGQNGKVQGIIGVLVRIRVIVPWLSRHFLSRGE
jgi:hypothetical protein